MHCLLLKPELHVHGISMACNAITVTTLTSLQIIIIYNAFLANLF